jgi:ribonuclease-3
LGDAVLELAVTEAIFAEFPSFEEGDLTLIRAALVNYLFLSKVASEIQLGDYLYLSRGEARDTSRARDVILANAIEALIGAMYLDQGYDAVKPFIKKFVVSKAGAVIKEKSYKDPKSLLQEYVQEKRRITPTYKVLDEFGPDHKKTFKVGVYIGEEKVGEGEGLSKQEAESDAAKNALTRLE